MYTEINQLIKMGLKKSQIARKMRISRPTLDKYHTLLCCFRYLKMSVS